jgi:hypothetical protein
MPPASAARPILVDGGDHRFVQVEPRGQPAEPRRRGTEIAAVGLLLEVMPGAERLVPATGEDRQPLLVVTGEVVKGALQLFMGCVVHGVVSIRPLQGDDCQVPFADHADELIVHRSLSRPRPACRQDGD